MKPTLLLAALLLAAPAAAFAQSTGQTVGTAQGNNPLREPNLANPQARMNEQANPPNAHVVTSGPGYGEANKIPTPTLNQPMTPTNKSR